MILTFEIIGNYLQKVNAKYDSQILLVVWSVIQIP